MKDPLELKISRLTTKVKSYEEGHDGGNLSLESWLLSSFVLWFLLWSLAFALALDLELPVTYHHSAGWQVWRSWDFELQVGYNRQQEKCWHCHQQILMAKLLGDRMCGLCKVSNSFSSFSRFLEDSSSDLPHYVMFCHVYFYFYF